MNRFFLPDGTMDMRRIARLISAIEDHPSFANDLLADLYQENDQSLVLGITGPPGAGKSTITDGIITKFRAKDKKVAVIAVDPSSPFSGGAILGDRIRMSAHAADPWVFIRSMGSRGSLGGLAPATVSVMNLLTSIGFDVVIIETVGVGQSEIDVMHLSDTVILALVPGLGDDIQALKAGIMEIADIFIINKADKPGKEKLRAEIQMILTLHQDHLDWIPPIVEMVAVENSGFGKLMEEIDRHKAYVTAHREQVKRPKLEKRFKRMIDDKIGSQILSTLNKNEKLNLWIKEVAAGQKNPYAAIQDIDNRLKVTWEG